jgi:E3 ubiquitin-protein ligase HUWE1
MGRLLIKKGLVTDLARVVHSLDLSSPYLASTVNAALKPLETLSRAVNTPPPGAAITKNKAAGDGAGPIVQEDNATADIDAPAAADEPSRLGQFVLLSSW